MTTPSKLVTRREYTVRKNHDGKCMPCSGDCTVEVLLKCGLISIDKASNLHWEWEDDEPCLLDIIQYSIVDGETASESLASKELRLRKALEWIVTNGSFAHPNNIIAVAKEALNDV